MSDEANQDTTSTEQQDEPVSEQTDAFESSSSGAHVGSFQTDLRPEPDIAKYEKDGFGMWKHPHYDSGGRTEAAALAIFAAAIYYRTLPPSITGGDSGEVVSPRSVQPDRLI